MFLFIFLCMLFCHIVDDYYLQGVLAKMKQISWWREQTNDPLYQNDWLPALIAHGISWSFMISLPCNIYLFINRPDSIYLFSIMFVFNAYLHCKVDNDKCNKHEINLITDQCMHLFQICVTFFVFLIAALT